MSEEDLVGDLDKYKPTAGIEWYAMEYTADVEGRAALVAIICRTASSHQESGGARMQMDEKGALVGDFNKAYPDPVSVKDWVNRINYLADRVLAASTPEDTYNVEELNKARTYWDSVAKSMQN